MLEIEVPAMAPFAAAERPWSEEGMGSLLFCSYPSKGV